MSLRHANRAQRRAHGARGRRIDLRPAGLVALAEGRLNAYRCAACHGYTITAQVHPGPTPMFLACRATTECEGTGASLNFPTVDSWPAHVPTAPLWEWYRPGADELAALADDDQATYQMVVAGQLLLRPYRLAGRA